jgi:hypothetical protein
VVTDRPSIGILTSLPYMPSRLSLEPTRFPKEWIKLAGSTLCKRSELEAEHPCVKAFRKREATLCNSLNTWWWSCRPKHIVR